jgi:glycosyltransferase involved in cell wall biosynthesis
MSEQRYGWPGGPAIEGPAAAHPEPSQPLRQTGEPRLRFSVVVPTLNQGDTIEDTLRSILEQDYSNVEIIVADGGSCDGTAAVLDRYRPHLARVFKGPDRGQSDAINKGFRAASGDILCWLNSDDYFLPGALRRVADRFAADPAVRFVVGAGDVISKDHRFLRHIPALPMTEATLLNWKNDQWVMQQCCFWSRSLWQEVGGVDENLHLLMDYDLWFRLSRATEATLIPEKLAVMRYHPDVKTVRQRSKSSEELAYVYAKNGAFQSLRELVAELVAAQAGQQERLSRIEASLPVRLLKRLSLFPTAP